MKGAKDNPVVSGTARPEIICFMAASMGLKKLKTMVPEIRLRTTKARKENKRCEQNRTAKKQRNNPQPVILHVTQIAKEQNV